MKNSKFNDLSALRDLKIELKKQEREAASSGRKDNEPRSHKVVLKTKEQHLGEEKARELGYKPGSVVTLMDSNDRGILKAIHKDHVEIEMDGLVIKAGFYDFVVNNPEEDRELMRRSGSSRLKKSAVEPVVKQSSNELSVDLHIEKIPGGYDAPEGFELPFQLDYFKHIMLKNLKHRGMRISFVHGVGDGILRDAIRKEIDEVYALRCSWAPGPAGVTIVTIK